MVDNRNRQHRPRTTRELRHRLEAAAREAGGEPNNYHEALEIATAYLELAVNKMPPCPNCGRDSLIKKSNERFKCTAADCAARPIWHLAVGIDGDTNADNPLSTSHTDQTKQMNRW